jgi:hypothetical protein
MLTLAQVYERALCKWSAACDNLVLSAILDAFGDNEDFPPLELPSPPVDLFYYSHAPRWIVAVEQQRIYL